MNQRKLRAVLVDDEVAALETLRWELDRNCPEVEVIASCKSGLEALEVIREQQPELLFLDINMPRLSGFDLLNQLEPSYRFKLIFTTAYDHFAAKAFRVNAIDYLLKPIDPAELVAAVSKAREQQAQQQQPVTMEQMRQFLQQWGTAPPRQHVLAFATLEGREFVQVDSIVHCEADSNYTNIYLEDGSRIVLTQTLGQVEHSLKDYDFARIHKSHLINRSYVRRYLRGSSEVEMRNGERIKVSRSRREEFLAGFPS